LKRRAVLPLSARDAIVYEHTRLEDGPTLAIGIGTRALELANDGFRVVGFVGFVRRFTAIDRGADHGRRRLPGTFWRRAFTWLSVLGMAPLLRSVA
jgi:hypothetical protein